MTDPTDPRAKAEASLRLSELARTPRARELFRQLAAEYEGRAKAEPVEALEAAPSIVPAVDAPSILSAEAAPAIVPAVPGTPMAETQQWLQNLAAVREES
jgi:hypothetical protein